MNKLAYTTIFLMFLYLVYSAFLTLYPYKLLLVNKATAPLTIKSGALMTYTVDYCKYTSLPAVVYRTMYSVDEKTIVPFPAVSSVAVKGCHVVDVPLQLYETTPQGDYYLLVNAEFTMRDGRVINVIFKTNNFQVQ